MERSTDTNIGFNVGFSDFHDPVFTFAIQIQKKRRIFFHNNDEQSIDRVTVQEYDLVPDSFDFCNIIPMSYIDRQRFSDLCHYFENALSRISDRRRCNLPLPCIRYLSEDIANETMNKLHSFDSLSSGICSVATVTLYYDEVFRPLPPQRMWRRSEVSYYELLMLNESSFSLEDMEKSTGDSVPKIDDIDSDEDCCVCLEKLYDAKQASRLITRLNCHHIFHQNCIFQWLRNKNSCPVCRSQVEEN